MAEFIKIPSTGNMSCVSVMIDVLSFCTSTLQYAIVDNTSTREGHRVIIVDTPSFDEDDVEILRRVSIYILTELVTSLTTLKVRYQHETRRYHLPSSITDKRMNGATRRNLDMFLREQRFCEGFSNRGEVEEDLPRPQRAFAFPNSHIVPLPISHTTQVTQTTDIGHKTCLRLLLGLGGSMGLSVLSYPKWVVCSFSSEIWECYLKSFKFRIPKFRRRISKELISGLDCAAGLRVLIVSVWCYRENIVWADVDTSESSHNHIFHLLLLDSPEQRKTTLKHFPFVQLPTTTTIYPLPPA